MSYLQITTKCNMTCAHCAFSCSRKGEHMEYHVALDAIKFLSEKMDQEVISIGGGEPTIHPRFFDILKFCLYDFNYVWMATNGKKTSVMLRLIDILDGEDVSKRERRGLYDGIYIEDGNKLTVELSLDYYHSPINGMIEAVWKNRSQKRYSSFGIRDVVGQGRGPIKVGRAKRTNNWAVEDECPCPTMFIDIKGNIKPCGCPDAPVVGDIWYGTNDEWDALQDCSAYINSGCWSEAHNWFRD